MSENNSAKHEENQNKSGFVKMISEPLSKHGWPAWLVYAISAAGLIYLLNPTLGIFELIPDNLPIVGNLDEGLATMLVIAGIVEALEGKKHHHAKKSEQTPQQEDHSE